MCVYTYVCTYASVYTCTCTCIFTCTHIFDTMGIHNHRIVTYV